MTFKYLFLQPVHHQTSTLGLIPPENNILITRGKMFYDLIANTWNPIVKIAVLQSYRNSRMPDGGGFNTCPWCDKCRFMSIGI